MIITRIIKPVNTDIYDKTKDYRFVFFSFEIGATNTYFTGFVKYCKLTIFNLQIYISNEKPDNKFEL